MGKHSNVVGSKGTESQDVLDRDGNPIPGTEQTSQEGGNTKAQEKQKISFLGNVFRKGISGIKWVSDHTPKPVKVIVTTIAIGGALYVAGREGYKLGAKSTKPLDSSNDLVDDVEETEDLLESEDIETPEGYTQYKSEDGDVYITDDPEVQSQLDENPAFSKVEEA